MTKEHILAASLAEPFQPFIIHIRGGHQFRVLSRQFLIFFEQSRIIVFHQLDGSILFIDPFLVSHLEFPAPGTASRLAQESEMTAEQLRDWYYREPFQPFALQLTDGRNVLVGKRQRIGFAPTGRFATVVQADDSFAFIELASIRDAVPADRTTNNQPQP